MLRVRVPTLALTVLAAAAPAQAALVGTCTVVATQAGTLAPNPAITVLGSTQGGGASATVAVDANSLLCSILNLIDCFSFSAVAPASFSSAPAGGDADVGFATVFRVDGGGSEYPGNVPRRITNGDHTMEIDLTATKASGVFPAGGYQAQVIARCE